MNATPLPQPNFFQEGNHFWVLKPKLPPNDLRIRLGLAKYVKAMVLRGIGENLAPPGIPSSPGIAKDRFHKWCNMSSIHSCWCPKICGHNVLSEDPKRDNSFNKLQNKQRAKSVHLYALRSLPQCLHRVGRFNHWCSSQQ